MKEGQRMKKNRYLRYLVASSLSFMLNCSVSALALAAETGLHVDQVGYLTGH